MKEATFRFYEELNDFLPSDKRKVAFPYAFNGTPSVKDASEALGVPHVEIDLILVDGVSTGFAHKLQGGERVSVYPVFESLDITPVVRLRPGPLRVTRFVVDVHLGKLASDLRLLGFDTLWRNDLGDPEIVRIAVRDKRVVLTRDLGILKTRAVERGYWLRSTDPDIQIGEVIDRLDLRRQFKPMTRCLACNGYLEDVEKAEIAAELENRTRLYYNEFRRCADCSKLFWQGSHHQALLARIDKLSRT
jgi:uncharacterized protein